jgi:hypothetical protein
MYLASNSHTYVFYTEVAPNKTTVLQCFRSPRVVAGASANGQS